MECDLIVVGAGIAGVGLADAAQRRGLHVVVLEGNDTRGYASVRNQGWLHSGALYVRDPKAASTVEKCKTGTVAFQALDRISTGLIISARPSIMIFKEPARHRLAFDAIREAGLFAEKISPSELLNRVPLLGSRRDLAGGILVQDKVLDSPRVLNFLMTRARAGGALFFRLPRDLLDLNPSFSNSMWSIEIADGTEVKAPNVFLTCGVLIPQLVGGLAGKPLTAVIRKCHVMAIHCKPCQEILIFSNEQTNLMNIAPFSDGITVNLGGRDRNSHGPSDLSIAPEERRLLLDNLAEWAPGLAESLPSTAQLYVCQKLEFDRAPHEGGRRDALHRQIMPGLHIFYPGKFTQALEASDMVLGQLLSDAPAAPHRASPSVAPGFWQYLHPGALGISAQQRVDRDFQWREGP